VREGERESVCVCERERGVAVLKNAWTFSEVSSEEPAQATSSGSEAGSYLRLIDFVYHSTLGLRVIKKKKRRTRSSDKHASTLPDEEGTTTSQKGAAVPRRGSYLRLTDV